MKTVPVDTKIEDFILVKGQPLKQEWYEEDGVMYFQLILPASKEEEQNSMGELVWCTAKDQAVADMQGGMKGRFIAELMNDSLYYPELKCHHMIVAEMQGDHMPIANHNYIAKSYGQCVKAQVVTQLEKGVIYDFKCGEMKN